MTDQKRQAPRRYFVDAQGRRVLIGLSLDETTEFEALDLSPLQAAAVSSGVGIGEPAGGAGEVRWLELYAKHEGAWRTWIMQSRAEQAQASGFINCI